MCFLTVLIFECAERIINPVSFSPVFAYPELVLLNVVSFLKSELGICFQQHKSYDVEVLDNLRFITMVC